ncbi:MAG TPA: outer membrane beta-barrel protein [Gemmatimonadales bacterium]|nr:outer membrane beta-barrel protein [Gemmatimonadales bacterium]
MNRTVAALAAGLIAICPLHAQNAEFSLGGGIGIPLGTFDDLVKVGWQGSVAVLVAPPNHNFGIRVDGNYAQFSDESPLDIKNQLLYGTANAVYRFQSSPGSRFKPYLIGGGGVYNSKAIGDDALEGSSTEFGLNLGAGFEFEAGGTGLFLEGRWHNLFLEGDNLKFFPLTLGITFGGD